MGTTPIVADSVVAFGATDGVVYAVEARSGKLAWTVPTGGKIYSSPSVEFGHLFIGSDDRHLYAIHMGGGRQAWRFQADGAVRTRPLLHENLIFFACQMGVVYALGLNRDMRWRFRARRGIRRVCRGHTASGPSRVRAGRSVRGALSPRQNLQGE